MARSLSLAALALCCACGSALADAIPYPNPGHANPELYSFTATTTGDLSAWFIGNGGAGFESTIGLLVNRVDTGIAGLDNQTSAYGQALDFGTVHAGDELVFKLDVLSTAQTFYTQQSLNFDGINHAYSTAFSGDAPHGIPAGTYIGMEDLAFGGDFNYTDNQFVVSNVTALAVPEPAPLALLLAGLGALGALGVVSSRRVPARGAAARRTRTAAHRSRCASTRRSGCRRR
jgi:hypothetical protein